MVRSTQSQATANFSALDPQLFAEISSDQAAIVEGGVLRVTITSLRCLEAGGGSDRVFAKFNGEDTSFGITQRMFKKSFANFSQSSNLNSSNGPITVNLRDAIGGSRTRSRSLGSFSVTSATASGKAIVSGSGSRYEVGFSAF